MFYSSEQFVLMERAGAGSRASPGQWVLRAAHLFCDLSNRHSLNFISLEHGWRIFMRARAQTGVTFRRSLSRVET
jgi:hypothetical protein